MTKIMSPKEVTRLQAVIDRLLSGVDRQTHGYLCVRSRTGLSYCIEGILADEYIKVHPECKWEPPPIVNTAHPDFLGYTCPTTKFEGYSIPLFMYAWFGLDLGQLAEVADDILDDVWGGSLIESNDNYGTTFGEFAYLFSQYIERYSKQVTP